MDKFNFADWLETVQDICEKVFDDIPIDLAKFSEDILETLEDIFKK